MTVFLIEYNLYQNVTNVSKNGKVESKNARLSSYMNRERLQNWLIRPMVGAKKNLKKQRKRTLKLQQIIVITKL